MQKIAGLPLTLASLIARCSTAMTFTGSKRDSAPPKRRAFAARLFALMREPNLKAGYVFFDLPASVSMISGTGVSGVREGLRVCQLVAC